MFGEAYNIGVLGFPAYFIPPGVMSGHSATAKPHLNPLLFVDFNI